MAERRMFSKTIIDSDMFLDMPQSSQLLYFHLSIRADDDGFINSPKKISRSIGCNEDDDIKILISKGYIYLFESGVVVIRHWKVHNSIKKDRYKETVYLEEKKNLIIVDNVYFLINDVRIQSGDNLDTQDRVRIELGKVSLGKSISSLVTTPFDYDIVKNQIIICYNELIDDNHTIKFSLDDVKHIFEYFYNCYYNFFLVYHPKLSNESIKSIINRIDYIEAEYETIDSLDYEIYCSMINNYFETDFREQCNHSISHFMNDNIRNLCYFNAIGK